MQNSKNEGLKKAVNAKVENREAKKEQYNANKAALAKRNAELEKKQLESEITMKRIKMQLDTANQDKAKFKRMCDELKRKGPGGVSEDLMLNVANSNASGGMSLKEARAQRKAQKTGSSIGNLNGLSARNQLSMLSQNSANAPAINVP